MSEPLKFLQLALRGEVMSDEIDDFVEAWHKSSPTDELSDFLGMTREEYSLWVSHPDYIDLIIAARRNKRPLAEAVNDNLKSSERLAARADDSRKLLALKRWIEAQPDR